MHDIYLRCHKSSDQGFKLGIIAMELDNPVYTDFIFEWVKVASSSDMNKDAMWEHLYTRFGLYLDPDREFHLFFED